jgi:ATP-dependent Clp protease adapter protein ClpS
MTPRILNISFLVLAILFSVVSALVAPALSSRRVSSSNSAVWGYAMAALERDTLVMMPSVIEKEGVKTGPAVLDRPETIQKERVDDPTKQRKSQGGEAWEVRIYNDGMNTREHVARSLVQVTSISEFCAYQTMMQAHQNGIAVVGRWCYEVAEMYHEALKKNGIVCDLVQVDEDA